MTPNGYWPADHVERRPIADLIPYARNSRLHSEHQVAQIAASMREWGWTIPLLIDEHGGIIAGHGRVRAAIHLGFNDAPCIFAHGWSEAKKRAYVIADNKLTLNASWDDDILRQELSDISELGFELDLTGFSAEEIKDLDGPEIETFTKKIAAPIYQPTGPCPPLSELCDTSKADALMEEIDKAKLPRELAEFLKLAAERHNVFQFAKIANYYAHTDEPVRRLMEKSALVIVDFNHAIENGFVRLSKTMEENFAADYPDAE